MNSSPLKFTCTSEFILFLKAERSQSLTKRNSAHYKSVMIAMHLHFSKERTQMDLKSKCENLLCEKPQL